MEHRKSWSYEELTDATEREIRSLLSVAASNPVKGRGRERDAERFAHGMFLNWNAITLGHQRIEDVKRLRELALGTANDTHNAPFEAIA